MGRRLLVTSNCQTGGLAAALRLLFPRDEIEPLPVESFKKEGTEQALIEKLTASDVWISISRWDCVEKWHLHERRPGFQLIRIPPLFFTAFHPDICYVKNAATKRRTKLSYSSAIVAWAYAHSVPAEEVAVLFNEGTFRRLGYFDRWDGAVAEQRRLFSDAGMDAEFDAYFRGVKRNGVFMHSHNHPKAATLTQLAKVIAVRLGADASLYDRQIDIPDALVNQTWPVYPEIAQSYSLPDTGYLWKLGGTNFIYGLRDYVQFVYSAYAEENLAPQDVIFDEGYDQAPLDAVLGATLGLGNV